MNLHGRKRLSLLITICIGIVLVALLTYAIYKRDRERREILSIQEKLRQRLESEKEKNRWLRGERDALKSDPVRIEKEARKELRYSNPEEVPYKKYNTDTEE